MEKIILSLLIFNLSFLYTNAQSVDTIASTDVYTILSTCNFNKTIIDGRDSFMFHSGHLKNAINIDAFGLDVSTLLQHHLNTDTLVIYCSNQTRSKRLIEEFQALHYTGHIIYMKDGLTGWRKQNLPLVNNQ